MQTARARRQIDPVPPRNTRSLARRLFPYWSRAMQARWVIAKLRVLAGSWAFPIGQKAVQIPDNVPEFLRALPPGAYLEPAPRDVCETWRGGLRYVRAMLR